MHGHARRHAQYHLHQSLVIPANCAKNTRGGQHLPHPTAPGSPQGQTSWTARWGALAARANEHSSRVVTHNQGHYGLPLQRNAKLMGCMNEAQAIKAIREAEVYHISTIKEAKVCYAATIKETKVCHTAVIREPEVCHTTSVKEAEVYHTTAGCVSQKPTGTVY